MLNTSVMYRMFLHIQRCNNLYDLMSEHYIIEMPQANELK